MIPVSKGDVVSRRRSRGALGRHPNHNRHTCMHATRTHHPYTPTTARIYPGCVRVGGGKKRQSQRAACDCQRSCCCHAVRCCNRPACRFLFTSSVLNIIIPQYNHSSISFLNTALITACHGSGRRRRRRSPAGRPCCGRPRRGIIITTPSLPLLSSHYYY